MTGPRRPPAGAGAGADEPMDERDEAVLSELRGLYSAADPVPAGLVERIKFAVDVTIDVAGLNVELARLTPTPELAGVRAAEHSRLITFDSETMTIMVSLTVVGGGVRVDGWLAPPGSHRIELRTAAGGRLTATADDQGRFVLSAVPHGLAQLVVEPTGLAGSIRSVVTPSVVI